MEEFIYAKIVVNDKEFPVLSTSQVRFKSNGNLPPLGNFELIPSTPESAEALFELFDSHTPFITVFTIENNKTIKSYNCVIYEIQVNSYSAVNKVVAYGLLDMDSWLLSFGKHGSL